MNMKRIRLRVEGRKFAREIMSLAATEHADEREFWEACIDEIAGDKAPPLPVAPEVNEPLTPIARLGAERMPFGEYRGKPLDDVSIAYLDWLCREQEHFYRTLRAYLKHPDLQSRRGDS